MTSRLGAVVAGENTWQPLGKSGGSQAIANYTVCAYLATLMNKFTHWHVCRTSNEAYTRNGCGNMTGHKCCICTSSKDTRVPFHHFPKEPGKRALWLCVFQVQEIDLRPSSRVCTRHFPEGDVKNTPSATLGKRFASPIKQGPRAKRARERSEEKQVHESRARTSLSSSSRSVTPAPVPAPTPVAVSPEPEALTAVAGGQYESDYQVHELPSIDAHQPSSAEVTVSTALLAHVEALEAENQHLKTLQ